MDPIIAIVRKNPFDDPGWTSELKYDGFRGISDTVHGTMLSRNRNHMWRFDLLLSTFLGGCIFGGEIVARGMRPPFNTSSLTASA
jgi:hypothetical protein